MTVREARMVWVAGLLLGVFAWGIGFGLLGPYAAIPAAAVWGAAVYGQGRSRCLPGPQIAWLFGIAAMLHLGVAFSGFESNDLHRYLWEGGIQLHGFSPYAMAPDAPPLVALRDARYEFMTFRELPSLYPPLAQLSFVSAAAAGLSETGYRNSIVLASLVLVGVIGFWLRATGRPVGRTLYYAWSPVAVVSAVGGHVDVLMAAALVGFVWAWESHRFRLACSLLGLGILAKTMAILLIPWALWRRPREVFAFTCSIVALGYLAYLPAGNIIGSLFTFASDFRFNASLYEVMLPTLGAMTGIVAAGLLVAWVGWCTLREDAPADMAVLVLGGLLLLAPVVHYWYATWLLAVLPGVRSVRLRIVALTWTASLAVLVPLYLAIAAGLPAPSAGPLIAIQLGLPLMALALCAVRNDSEDSTCVSSEPSSPLFQR